MPLQKSKKNTHTPATHEHHALDFPYAIANQAKQQPKGPMQWQKRNVKHGNLYIGCVMHQEFIWNALEMEANEWKFCECSIGEKKVHKWK